MQIGRDSRTRVEKSLVLNTRTNTVFGVPAHIMWVHGFCVAFIATFCGFVWHTQTLKHTRTDRVQWVHISHFEIEKCIATTVLVVQAGEDAIHIDATIVMARTEHTHRILFSLQLNGGLFIRLLQLNEI